MSFKKGDRVWWRRVPKAGKGSVENVAGIFVSGVRHRDRVLVHIKGEGRREVSVLRENLTMRDTDATVDQL